MFWLCLWRTLEDGKNVDLDEVASGSSVDDLQFEGLQKFRTLKLL